MNKELDKPHRSSKQSVDVLKVKVPQAPDSPVSVVI
jgi:hypothetical protein